MTERDEPIDWIARIRERPGMWVGSVHDGQGLHHLLWELCANAIDLYLRRASSRLHVSIDGDVLTVDDDGHGYPVDESGTPLVTAYLTTVHDTATRDDHSPHVHVGGTIHGVGIAAVNALSEWLEITTRIEGREWHQRFERGRPVTELRDVGPAARRGTTIRYRPDLAIFGDITPDRARIRDTLHELAYLNDALDVRLDDTDLSEPEGLSALVRAAAAPHVLLDGSPIRATATRHDVHVDVAIGWTGEDRDARICSFVRQVCSREGGTHVAGLHDGLRAVARSLFPGQRSTAVRRGLVAVVHAGLYHPRWGSPTRERLMSPEARAAVREVVRDCLGPALRQREALVSALASRVSYAP